MTWKSRMDAAERYAQSRAGTISFAVVDEAGHLHGYHARAVAPSASVLKAMLLVAYLRRDDVRHRPLEQWERDLLAPMIRWSDNAAATRMVQLVGEARLNAGDVMDVDAQIVHGPVRVPGSPLIRLEVVDQAQTQQAGLDHLDGLQMHVVGLGAGARALRRLDGRFEHRVSCHASAPAAIADIRCNGRSTLARAHAGLGQAPRAAAGPMRSSQYTNGSRLA